MEMVLLDIFIIIRMKKEEGRGKKEEGINKVDESIYQYNSVKVFFGSYIILRATNHSFIPYEFWSYMNCINIKPVWVVVHSNGSGW